MKRILFLCTGNSARSQIAEGLMRHYYGDEYEVYSAGVAPSFVNPYAIEAMKLEGIDISSHQSKSIEDLPHKNFDIIVTVCDNAKESCPFFPGQAKRLHFSFRDPVDLDDFIDIRNQIKETLLNEFGG